MKAQAPPPLFCSAYTVAGAPPGAAPRFDFAARVAAVADAGMNGLTVHDADPALAPARVGAAREALASSGLVVPAVDFVSDWHLAGRDTMAEALRVAEAMDAPLIHMGADLAADMPPLSDLIGPFRSVCCRAADAGRRVALEPLAWGRVCSVEVACELIDRAGPGCAGLVLDLWHLCINGTPARKSLGSLDLSLVSTVQISDAAVMTNPSPDALKEATRERAFPGDGTLDCAGFLAALWPALDRSGVTVEVLSPAAQRHPIDQTAERAATSARQVIATAAKLRAQDRSGDRNHG
ncbi:sugar phosphate isomerase/epimerase family protein [Marinovum sp.]|uniref:sugar phosphate isomerase/epimerase family protein n=1 Tax=Marinovum sp. TaxID=2024839 RepID=UPI002B275521|nr:TIM barrel protein [Marinovum sp.]